MRCEIELTPLPALKMKPPPRGARAPAAAALPLVTRAFSTPPTVSASRISAPSAWHTVIPYSEKVGKAGQAVLFWGDGTRT